MQEEYIIYRNAVHIDTEVYQHLLKQSDRSRPIFNSRRNDNRRQQCKLIDTALTKPLMDLLRKMAADHHTTLKMSSWSILISLSGCNAQLAHIDYILDESLRTAIDQGGSTMPVLMFVSLQPDTSIYLWLQSSKVVNGTYTGPPILPTKILLSTGDVLLFRADVVHAGGDYDKQNIRLHCYLDSDSVPRTPNRTFVISKHGSDAMRSAIQEVHT